MNLPTVVERTLVLGIKSSGEHFNQMDLLSAESGSFLALKRISKSKPQTCAADLFDSADVHLQSSRDGNIRFVNDYQLVQRRSQIGHSYKKLRYAAEFCALIALNGPHMADPSELYLITERTLNAFVVRALPSIVFLKAIYLLLSSEGYPVREAWWPQLPQQLRGLGKPLLNQPTPDHASTQALDACTQISQQLCHWLHHETDLILPDCLQ